MIDYHGMIDKLSNAPSNILDESMQELIKKWNNPPTPIQVLEVLDKCIFSSLCSDFIIIILQHCYDEICLTNNTNHEEVVKQAVWRDNGF